MKVEKGWYLGSFDTNTELPGSYTIVHFFKGESGHIYFYYENSSHYYCPINNYYIDNCPEEEKCSACPQAEHFLELEDGEKIPVLRLPLYGRLGL